MSEVSEEGSYDTPSATPRDSLYDTPRARSIVMGDTPDHALYDRPRSARLVGDTLELYDTPPPSRAVSTNSESSGLHYTVRASDGRRDIYSKPSLRLKPPDLPPRNTPRQSLASPDYMDVEEEIESLETFQPNSVARHCEHCKEELDHNSRIINSNGDLYHRKCFVCAQCFQEFPDGVFFEFEGRRYCQHDFQVLFAPCCAKCSEFILGRVIRALSASWHPACLTCSDCDRPLAEVGFTKLGGRPVCRECGARLKERQEGPVCRRCGERVEGEPLSYQGNTYHPYHFTCAGCGVELTSTAREVRTRPGLAANKVNVLYCLRCHDKMNIPICGACRRPIEGRVVTALGKHWHVEHFACAKCEKPFLGHRHYQRAGLAYCAHHYHQLFGELCYHCNGVIEGDTFSALGKAWCSHHFSCSACDKTLGPKTKFFEVDLKPVCKKCLEKYPRQFRVRLKQYHDIEIQRDGKSKLPRK